MNLRLKALSWCLIIWFCLFAGASAAPRLQAQAAVLMDATTGVLLFDKNMHKRCAPASTTKILTAIIALESGRLHEQAIVSSRAANTPGSSMHLYPGQKISVLELVWGLLLRSGNDAAVALAEHLAGSVEAFVSLMNEKAAQIGALNSHFANPHGLTAPGHFSTAYDLAILTRYALNNPLFAEIVRTKEIIIEWLDRSGQEKERTLRNTNKLLWMFDDADGVKTGTTDAAGPCLVASATRGHQKLIAVVLNDRARWYDSMQLLKYGFDAFDLFHFAAQEDVVAVIPVEGGMQPVVDAIVAVTAAVVVNYPDFRHVTVSLHLPEKIKAPIYRGQKLGEVEIFIKGKSVKTVDVIAAQDVEERTFKRVLLGQLFTVFRLLSRWGMV